MIYKTFDTCWCRPNFNNSKGVIGTAYSHQQYPLMNNNLPAKIKPLSFKLKSLCPCSLMDAKLNGEKSSNLGHASPTLHYCYLA